MAVAQNADAWAVPRVGWFFPGVVPSLDGQCVSLTKWFLQDMTLVPNPQAARGDARYVGKTLVAQGHAVEVNWAERRRGDIICYEYGQYGHIAQQLSGGQVFEENVNMPGTTRQWVDGAWVYSARIGYENESWRQGKNPHIYRVKTYYEGEIIVDNVRIAQQPIIKTTKGGKRIDMFCMGSDNGLWQKYFSENGWSEWVQVGKAIISLDEVVIDGDRYDVYCRGGSTDVMHFWLDESGWHLESLGIPKGQA